MYSYMLVVVGYRPGQGDARYFGGEGALLVLSQLGQVQVVVAKKLVVVLALGPSVPHPQQPGSSQGQGGHHEKMQ